MACRLLKCSFGSTFQRAYGRLPGVEGVIPYGVKYLQVNKPGLVRTCFHAVNWHPQVFRQGFMEPNKGFPEAHKLQGPVIVGPSNLRFRLNKFAV